MMLSLQAKELGGTVSAVSSKSAAHRMLICAAFSPEPTVLQCQTYCEDLQATVRCLNAIGAGIARTEDGFFIQPVDRAVLPFRADLDVGESASTLRFLLPVVCALGISATFLVHGRLTDRSLDALLETLCSHGINISAYDGRLRVSGRLLGHNYVVRGEISSQFLSGLLFALPLIGGGKLLCTGQMVSAPYVHLTQTVLQNAGISVAQDGGCFTVSGSYCAKNSVVSGDWTGAANWLCAGALSDTPVTVIGLDPSDGQGDRVITDLLRRFGAVVRTDDGCVTCSRAPLGGIRADLTDYPDLAPCLAVVGSAARGETVLTGIGRLRDKESDRAAAITETLRMLGADVSLFGDTIRIHGGRPLSGGTVSSHCDHRIAMMAALLSLLASGPVFLRNAECVGKSYPSFYDDFRRLGGMTEVTSDE